MEVGGKSFRRGEIGRVEIPVARLPTLTMLHLPVTVVRGAEDGPGFFLTAALHGDEVNGVEIIRRVLLEIDPKRLAGTIFAAPVVNVFGFIHQSRYLPDRRDLNRSFPGSARGSLASRLAHTLMSEVVEHCDYGVDLHTGSLHRNNWPQIRVDLDDGPATELAVTFGAPVALHSRPPEGSLRRAANRTGVHTVTFEGGEILRFSEHSLEVGAAGVRRCLHHVGMIEHAPPAPEREVQLSRRSPWVRAPLGGILRMDVELGERVEKDRPLGKIAGPLGEGETVLRSSAAGTIIGLTDNPLVNRGDAVAHIARPDEEDDPEA